MACLALDKLYGPQMGQYARRFHSELFFEQLRKPTELADHARDLGFITACYLPKRFGPQVTTAYLRDWMAASTTLSAKGYTSNEAYAAFYSRLTGENLAWLFNLCGFDVSADRVSAATALLPEEWRMKASRPARPIR